MQRYDISIPFWSDTFTPENLHLAVDGRSMQLEGDFYDVAHATARAGKVSYLPACRMYGFEFYINDGALRGLFIALYENLSVPDAPLIRPWHEYRHGVIKSRLTMADAAYIVLVSALRNGTLGHADDLADEMLTMLNQDGYSVHMPKVVDCMAERYACFGEDETAEENEESPSSPIKVFFTDHTALHLTPEGPVFPIGLSNRSMIAKIHPEAATVRGSIFLKKWLGAEATIPQLS